MHATLVHPLRGMGYVPGVVRGRLTRNPASKGILLADHNTLQGLSASPVGCVLLDAAPFSVDVAHAPYLARTVATRSSAEDHGLAEAVCAAASAHAVADLLGVWHEGKR